MVIAPPVQPAPVDAQLQENLARYQVIAEDLEVTVAQTEVIQRQVDGLRLKMGERRAAVGRLAAASYRSFRADTFKVLLDARSSTDLRDRMLVLNIFARQRQHEIRDLFQTTERFVAAQRTLDSLIAQQRAQQEELIAQRHLIEIRLSELKKPPGR